MVLCCGENVLVWLLISNLSCVVFVPRQGDFLGLESQAVWPGQPCRHHHAVSATTQMPGERRGPMSGGSYFYFFEADDTVFLAYSLYQVRVDPHGFRLKTLREEYLSFIIHRRVHIETRRCVKAMLIAHDLSASRIGTVKDLELSVQVHVRPWGQHPTSWSSRNGSITKASNLLSRPAQRFMI